MDGLTGWDVIQPSENFFLEKPASSNLNVENIPTNGDVPFLQMAGKLLPQCMVSHHRHSITQVQELPIQVMTGTH